MNENAESAVRAAIESAEAAIAALRDDAIEVGDLYWEHVNAYREGYAGDKKWEAYSPVRLSIRLAGNSLELRWQHVKWLGSREKRYKLRTWLETTSDGGYSEATLRKHTAPWETDIAIETEKRLHVLRRQSKHMVKAIMSMRNALRVSEAYREAVQNALSENEDYDANEDRESSLGS